MTIKNHYGPTIPISEWIHSTKYRAEGESFKDAMARVAGALKDNEEHFIKLKDILYNQRFLPAGRVQSAIGSPKKVTPYNCFVSQTIPDSMNGIMQTAAEAAETMRLGGGIGYDFSTLRPRGDYIRSLGSRSSGPISFMGIFDSVCSTISSAGHRRGAQMGVLRVDHPDIVEFVKCKANLTKEVSNKLANFCASKGIVDKETISAITEFTVSRQLSQFNISVGITDKFMDAVKQKKPFDLTFEGRVYDTVDAVSLWEMILRNTWDWAEPGVLFIDRINNKNNLHYIETIAATNPCGEQPLPPYGACLLGSFNLVKYLKVRPRTLNTMMEFDYEKFKNDIPYVVRAMDNVVDRAVYPLPQQEKEAKDKRRMGLGVTGLANALEICGMPYGSEEFLSEMEKIFTVLRDTAYTSSIELSIEKGAFPLFSTEMLDSEFAMTLPEDIRKDISTYGIRNSHLLSIAPTGTISLSADNVSSGIEPTFSHYYDRKIQTFEGERMERVEDYAYREYGTKGRTANEISVFDHVNVLCLASKYVDSACSKTCNVGDDVSWEDFKEVYMRAYEGGASGCTTFRASGKRFGILTASKDEEVVDTPEEVQETFVDEGGACYFDPETGLRSCE